MTDNQKDIIANVFVILFVFTFFLILIVPMTIWGIYLKIREMFK